MGNKFCHIELTTGDQGAAKEFYGSLFEWELRDMDMGEGIYTGIVTGADPGGGIMTTPAPGIPTAWMVYIEVPDLEASMGRATELGGHVIMGRTPVSDMGAFAVLTDPQGGVFGIWEPAKQG